MEEGFVPVFDSKCKVHIFLSFPGSQPNIARRNI